MDLEKYYELVEKSDFIANLKGVEKKCNRAMWLRKDWERAVQIFQEIEDGKKKEPHHYYFQQHYEILKISDEVHVCVKRKNQHEKFIYIIPLENCYEYVLEAHIKSGHGGRDRAYFYSCDKWKIPKSAFKLFASMCKSCNLKKGKVQKGVVVKSITTDGFNVRCQMDLVDFQSCPDGDYNSYSITRIMRQNFYNLDP